MLKTYYTYILSNIKNDVLYVGVTNNLIRRVGEHKAGLNKGFTYKYNVDKLVYYEEYNFILDAIRREKQLKGFRRSKKIALINSINPDWKDLMEEFSVKPYETLRT